MKTNFVLAATPFNTKQIGGNDDALTHRREVCFFTPKNKRAKKQIALSAMLLGEANSFL